jgi:hypothetical protein
VWFLLALEMRMPVQEIQQKTTSTEFLKWSAFLTEKYGLEEQPPEPPAKKVEPTPEQKYARSMEWKAALLAFDAQRQALEKGAVTSGR